MSAGFDGHKKVRDVSLLIPLRVRADGDYQWPANLKSRRRLLREFDRWYKANQQNFTIKLKFMKRTDTCIDFSFVGISSVIRAYVFPDEIAIDVTWQDKCWDFLVCIETYPIRIPAGYVCGECDPEVRPIVPTREMLWRIELFEALRHWVNHELAPATHLSIKGLGGMTMAKLVEGP